MKVQLLIAAVNQTPRVLADKMNISSDALIINQCDHFSYEEFQQKGHTVKAYSFAERGVGLSRNNALLRAETELALFSDEDIVYVDGYEELVRKEFAKHKEADLILFNFDVCEERKTYHNEGFKKVKWYNCGRYPTFSFAVRIPRIHQKNITYSLLFGGGAKYSNGEDSLFLKECIQKGLQVYASGVTLGREEGRPSTWFSGYHEKFFLDRGVLYHYLYGIGSYPLALRFLLRHKGKICETISFKQAWTLMKKGIRMAKSE